MIDEKRKEIRARRLPGYSFSFDVARNQFPGEYERYYETPEERLYSGEESINHALLVQCDTLILSSYCCRLLN